MNIDEMREEGITCNDCYFAMQNCHDRSICCEDETNLCDYFEPMKGTDGEFRHKELCEECYEYLCEKDEAPKARP